MGARKAGFSVAIVELDEHQRQTRERDAEQKHRPVSSVKTKDADHSISRRQQWRLTVLAKEICPLFETR